MLKLKRAIFLVARKEPAVVRWQDHTAEEEVRVKARGTQNKDRMKFLKTFFNPKFKNKVLSGI